MKTEKHILSDIYNVTGGVLTSYITDRPLDSKFGSWKRPAVIIVPGGAYSFCSKREAEIVALEFLSRGFHAFVLEYLCVGDAAAYPEQMLELAASVDFTKKNAAEMSINPKEIFAVGFSAGGHLVGCLSTDYRTAQNFYSEKLDCELTAAGLIYPVISDKYGHLDSHDNIFRNAGEKFRKDNIRLTRLDENVCQVTAPAYIFSTAQDKTVPPVNAMRYAEALSRKNIPFELHISKNGKHGMSTGSAEINSDTKGISRNRAWLSDCVGFFREYIKEEF